MPQIRHVPEDSNSIIPGRKVYFACHPEDHKLYFDEITAQLREISACTVFYYGPEENVALDEDYYGNLKDVNLMVIPVTTRLLCTPNRAMDVEVAYAVAQHIPVLPLMQETGLEKAYGEKFGDLQYLDPHLEDPTAIPYAEKLKKYLESVLISDELAKKIRAAFDACVFLSYRKKDRKYAQELMRLLHRDSVCRDIAIWYDEFLKPGEDFNKTIQKALEDCKLFALTVTPSLLEKPDGKPNYILLHEYPQAHDSHKPILPVQMVDTDADELRSCCPGIPDAIDPSDESAMTGAILEAMRDIALRQNDKDPQHNFFIGLAYLTGIDVEVDHEKAVELITSAAEAGLTEAMDKLVSMYETGEGVVRNYHTAIHWRERKADKYRLKYEETGNISEYYWCLHRLGNAKMAMMDYSGAEKAYLIMLSLAEEELRLHPYLGTSCLEIGYECLADLYYRGNATKENLHKAREMAAKRMELVLARYKKDPDFNWFALYDCYRTLGHLAIKESDQQNAKHWYLKCLDMLEEQGISGPVKGKGYVSQLYLNLGDICMEEGSCDEARDWYTKGLKYAEAMVPMHADYRAYLRHCYNRLFVLCDREALYARGEAEKQKFAEAKAWALKDVEILEDIVRTEKMDDMEKLFAGYYHVAHAATKTEELFEARSWCDKAYKIAKMMLQSDSLSAKVHMFRICAQMGDICRHWDALDKAREWYFEALEYEDALIQYGTTEEMRGLYGVYQGIGDICTYFGDRKAAAHWYEKKMKIAEELVKTQLPQDIERLAFGYYDLAKCYRDRKRMQKHREIYAQLAADYPDEHRYGRIVREIEEEIKEMRLINRIWRKIRRKKEEHE